MHELSVWIVDDDTSIRWVLERALANAGATTRCFPGAVEVLEALNDQQPDVLVTDVRMPGIDGLALLERVHAAVPALPVIVMTAYSHLDNAVAAYRGGVFEYLPKPFDIDMAVELIHRAAQTGGMAGGQVASPAHAPDGPSILGESAAMQTVFRAIGRLSRSHVAVMITGESGTGKELVARALHRHSPRSDYPLIAVNTAAVPEQLLESEFFGHEKGAFTGAQSQRHGRFEQAHDGTLFLDEIGDMSPALQTRLLRVLQDGTFYRVGGHQMVTVDVRIIAATNQDLEWRVQQGDFREDLYYRLNVIRIQIPALRERAEDVPLLLSHFLERAANELGVDRKHLSTEVMDLLTQLAWPGNVRQLESLSRWLTVMAPGQAIVIADLPAELQASAGTSQPAAVRSDYTTEADADWGRELARWAEQRLAAGDEKLLDQALPRFERVILAAAMEHTHGHRQEAARLLGWGRNTLTRKLKALHLDD